jgi:hypothetical protein
MFELYHRPYQMCQQKLDGGGGGAFVRRARRASAQAAST